MRRTMPDAGQACSTFRMLNEHPRESEQGEIKNMSFAAFDFSTAQALTNFHAALSLGAAEPFNQAARVGAAFFDLPPIRAAFGPVAAMGAGTLALADRLTRTYPKQAWDIPGHTPEAVMSLPFGDLVHFESDAPNAVRRPRVLLVAPMSGHFATLLRDTVRGLTRDHDVYVTDWRSASQVPLSAGRFDLDTYMIYLKQFFGYFGGDVHAVAVCQPGVPLLATVSLMEEDNNPNAPKSMTLMGSPIDTRINPCTVNRLATEHDLGWFERNMISTVPPGLPGAGRKIYAGFMQLTAFMSMNAGRHRDAHLDMMHATARGDRDAVTKFDGFYGEYNAVMDMPEEFYLSTIGDVFIDCKLAKGEFVHTDEQGRKRKVDPAKIRRVALMTVEGERDDIAPPGQCLAAHDLCSALPASRRVQWLQPGAGHYGIFDGKRWRSSILPLLSNFIESHDLHRTVVPAQVRKRMPAMA
ncbi:MAG: polyhydroxyalkanoate depolymerase [Rhodospirillales bacterium]|nr:polyhydroxyalkanoate depolymerase [Alphaproteobacteria bacterium]MCB9986296.1 polyhydroxyalkanoate depolymerase [Rhodospirillales bacterium]USO07151.1 MAG: polyhydroxyalkanoate depolymerase [Rhodospirillales bacterium]